MFNYTWSHVDTWSHDHMFLKYDILVGSLVNVSIVPINSSVNHMTDNATFTCHSDAHDLNISYTWMFNGMYINSTSSTSDDSFVIDGPQLAVYNVTESLGGIYECIVTNLIGTGRGRSYLFGMSENALIQLCWMVHTVCLLLYHKQDFIQYKLNPWVRKYIWLAKPAFFLTFIHSSLVIMLYCYRALFALSSATYVISIVSFYPLILPHKFL